MILPRSTDRLIGPSMYLFLDLTLVAFTGWLYWLVISKIASATEIGEATAIYSLVSLLNTIAQLGLEYPLLKSSSSSQAETVGNVLLIEMIITLPVLPLMFYVINDVYQESIVTFSWLAAVLLLCSSSSFVFRFTLLGLSKSRGVLIADVIGAVIKFLSGYVLITYGFGALGLLTSFVLQSIVVCGITLYMCNFAFKSMLIRLEAIKGVLKIGLVNTPAKFSRLVVVALSVVLLGSLGMQNSEIGVFYICLMISIVAGSLASSMAYMVIPASTELKTDISTGAMRIGLSLTVPIITALLSEPSSVLGTIGPQYISSGPVLGVLALGILPASIGIMSISRFNNLNMNRKILIVGTIEVISFLSLFYILVPTYGIFGAALSITAGFTISCIPIIIWSEKSVMKYIRNCAISILGGTIIGFAFALVYDNSILHLLISISVSILLIFILKNTSWKEISEIVRGIIKNFGY